MTMFDQLEKEPAIMSSEAPSRVEAGIKTILLHIQNEQTLDRALETALALARSCDAHLSCLRITPIQAYVAFDPFGGVFVMDDVLQAIEEANSRVGERLQAELANEDISWNFTQTTGDVTRQLVGRAALSDLIVTCRDPGRNDFQGSDVGMLGDLLHRSRTPLFIAADDGRIPDPAGPALIAWNGSVESANAVRSAVGLLKLASEVQILRIDESKDETFPSTTVLEYLSRHGVHAQLKVETSISDPSETELIRACLYAEAKQMRAAYMVMGGYSHSRVSEYMFGGLTRSVLRACSLPVFMAH